MDKRKVKLIFKIIVDNAKKSETVLDYLLVTTQVARFIVQGSRLQTVFLLSLYWWIIKWYSTIIWKKLKFYSS